MWLYVRSLTPEEQARAEALARSSETVTYRRARIVLLSSQGSRVPEIMAALGLSDRSTRKKGQQTWNAYVSLDAKENRLSRRCTKHTNRWETALFVSERLWAHERLGHRVLVLIWDGAPWHVARDLMSAIRAHNRQVDQQRRGVKIVPVTTAVHAFWLNRVEAIPGHAKRKVLPCRQFTSPLEQQAALDRHWLQLGVRPYNPHTVFGTISTLRTNAHLLWRTPSCRELGRLYLLSMGCFVPSSSTRGHYSSK